MNYTTYREKCSQHEFDFGLNCLAFFGCSNSRLLMFWRHPCGRPEGSGTYSKIHDSLLVITLPYKSDLFQVVQDGLDICAHNTPVHLQHYVFADFPYTQIFNEKFPNIVAVHAQFTCGQTVIQPMMATHTLF